MYIPGGDRRISEPSTVCIWYMQVLPLQLDKDNLQGEIGKKMQKGGSKTSD